jgi:hypothetical protein
MPPEKTAELDYRPSYLAAALTAVAVFILYCLTLAPSTAMWDTSEYISAAYVFGLPHPPGNPLFVLLGRTFAILPLGGLSVAVKVNLLAAICSALSAAMWFLIAERILVNWLPERWQRITGGVVAATIGATAFTVWNQSVVNEKVYTVAALGLAIISWLTVRWSDDPDGPNADKTLVLIAYLGGLGYANHMMGFLAGPAVLAAVFTRRPNSILRWKLVLACVGALLLGMTPFLTQPIRSAHFPAINEGEPTTWNAFWDNFNRVQYAKPPLLDRQAPFFGFDIKWNGWHLPPVTAHLYGQLGMYWHYFRWQWFRDPSPTNASAWWQSTLAAVFFLLGALGGWVHWRRDRRSWWYFATFMFTLTLVLIYYLNFKFGHSQAPELGESVPREVRDRDYFFMVSFAAWGVWAALGLVWVWEGVAEVFGVEKVKVGRTTMEVPLRRGWLFATPVLAIAFVPLFLNYHAASRAHQTDTRDFAHDLLDSVEPYGVLVTAGDNDTFPLWYAQEVEGIRKDVLVLCTSLLNTDWYIRQMIRRPVYDYDAAKGPSIYRGKTWVKPVGSPIKMTMDEANALPEYIELREPQMFTKDSIHARLQPQLLERANIVILRIIKDDYPARPLYFSRTMGGTPGTLGLNQYLLGQGLARKLMPTIPKATPDTLRSEDGWLDLKTTLDLWNNDFLGPQAVIKRGLWVDRASVGIPYIYIATGIELSNILAQRGDTAQALKIMGTTRQVMTATGLQDMFTAQPRGREP